MDSADKRAASMLRFGNLLPWADSTMVMGEEGRWVKFADVAQAIRDAVAEGEDTGRRLALHWMNCKVPIPECPDCIAWTDVCLRCASLPTCSLCGAPTITNPLTARVDCTNKECRNNKKPTCPECGEPTTTVTRCPAESCPGSNA